MQQGIAGYSLLRWHCSPNMNTVFLTPRQLQRRQPDSKKSQINFKLAAQAKCTSTFITMLQRRAGYSLLRWHGSPSIKICISIDVAILSQPAR